MFIQVCGWREGEDEEIEPFVCNEDADRFGVYRMVDFDHYSWIADFDTREDAIKFAEYLAADLGYKIDDKTWSRS